MASAPAVERVEEVAIAVEDADAAVTLFERLFGLAFAEEWRIEDDHMRVRAATLAGTQVHLVEPTAEAGPIHAFLAERGEGIHHVAFRVADLEATIAHLREVGARLVAEEPREHDGLLYTFVHPSSAHGVLVELIEVRE